MIEPTVCVPVATGPILSATAAAEPLEDFVHRARPLLDRARKLLYGDWSGIWTDTIGVSTR